MSLRNFNNVTGRGTLTSSVTPGTTQFVTTGFSNPPTAPFTITVDRNTATEEICLVTAVAADLLTVTRGYDGTAAQTHLAGAVVEHSAGAIEFREANAHVNAVEGAHGTTGAVVGTEGSQTIFDKSLISSLHEADPTLGDAVVAYVPAGAEVRNLFRGMDPNGDDVFLVDSTGRATAAPATAPEHLARKSYVDAGDSALSTRVTANETTLNAATASPTASTIAKRDANGRMQAAAPAAAADVARKSETDGLDTRVTTAEGTLSAATSAATANALAKRDAAGRMQVSAPSAAADVARKDTVDAVTVDRPTMKTGSPTITTDASGNFTVTHSLGNVPSAVFIQARQAGGYTMNTTAATSTTFTGRAYLINGGAAAASASIAIYWIVVS